MYVVEVNEFLLSARRVSAAYLACKDVDTFSKAITLLKQILRQSLAFCNHIIYFFHVVGFCPSI
jgi:hypothetical protein